MVTNKNNMKTTYELLFAYLSINIDKKDLRLDRFLLNGSTIILEYSYNPQYDWDMTYISDEVLTVELLDYITFVCQL